MVKNFKDVITVLLVIVMAMLMISSVAIASPTGKSKNDVSKKLKVNLDANIMKIGDVESQQHYYGKVDLKQKETMNGDYKTNFKIDMKHASRDTAYDMYLWADIPDISLTILGELSNLNWYYFESIFVYSGYDLDYTINGKIETSLGTLEISGYHIRDTMHDIQTDNHGNYKCKFKDELTQEEIIESVIDFTWPYVRQHMIGLIPGLAPYLPLDPGFSTLGITSVTLYGGTYSVSTGLIFVGPQDVYYTGSLSFVYKTDDFVWTV